jgi:hypothetical protein
MLRGQPLEDHRRPQPHGGLQPRIDHLRERLDLPRLRPLLRRTRRRRPTGPSCARYFFTVRQSQPAAAAISAYVTAPASCTARNLLMSIQISY